MAKVQSRAQLDPQEGISQGFVFRSHRAAKPMKIRLEKELRLKAGSSQLSCERAPKVQERAQFALTS